MIDFERRNWWEGPEAQLDLDNHLFTNSTALVTVYNPNITYEAATISFEAATAKIKDSANGLGNFLLGDAIYVRGATNPSNNQDWSVVTAGASEIVVTGPGLPLIDEAAGATVTIQGAYCNYDDIDGADVTGDLPAPTRIERSTIPIV